MRNHFGMCVNYTLHYGWVCFIVIAMLGKIIITSPKWIYYAFVIAMKRESNVFDKTIDYIMREC